MAAPQTSDDYGEAEITSDLQFVRRASAKMRRHEEQKAAIADDRAIVIRRLRERGKLTVQAIADACGVSRMAVDSTLRARKPRKATRRAKRRG